MFPPFLPPCLSALHLWCRGRESNPHGPCGPTDFKSAASPSSATPAIRSLDRLPSWRRRADSNRLIEVLQTSALATWLRRPSVIWSGKRDSNPRPQPWQGCALPLSYSREFHLSQNQLRTVTKALRSVNLRAVAGSLRAGISLPPRAASG